MQTLINNEASTRLRIAVAGLGKMGLSHYSIINTHPDVELVAVCDPASYILRAVAKYTDIATYTDFNSMLKKENLDAVIIATPSSLHSKMVQAALHQNLHIFCEKPFCLDVEESQRLAYEAEQRNVVTQVGYHHRFISTFEETKKIIDQGLIGRITHVKVECYGPVVLRTTGSTWRARQLDGGGCLYDYASHGIDLLNYLLGQPTAVSGSFLGKIFSTDVDDEVYSTLLYNDGKTAQVCANWSDDSQRKMSTTVSAWGTNGKIIAGRQEIDLYLRSKNAGSAEYDVGLNKIYTTSLTVPVWFYLRGEEYSAQLAHFISCIKDRTLINRCTFRTASATDIVSHEIRRDAETNRTLANMNSRDSKPKTPGNKWLDLIK